MVGVEVSFQKKDFPALKDDLRVKLEPYITKGPRAFICDNVGPVMDAPLQHLIAKHMPGNNFWFGTQSFFGIQGNKRVCIFEAPTTCYKFEIPQEVGGFTVRFRAVNRSSECRLCEEQHATLSCGALQSVETPADLIEARLLSKPFV